jgi:dihydrofolate synthase / folylpolyglutamate synthase
MRPITNLKEAEAALEPFLPVRLKRYAYTTDHILQFMDYLGNPQNTPRSIHIAGTSGKTSTAYYAAALLRQTGKKVGLLISPHVKSINERVQINMEPLAEKTFCKELTQFLGLVEKSGITLTHNEVLYAFAYWEFARHGVEHIVVETGLGGLLDATNVIDRPDKVCIITDIGLDHTSVLGGTLEEITQHKTGIIHLGNTVFCYRQEPVIMQGIQDACMQNQADLHTLDERAYVAVDLPLFQRRNLTLALAAVRVVLAREHTELTEEQIASASRTLIPARMEVVEVGEKVVVLDGAHNPQKTHALRKAMEASFAGRPVAILAAFVDSTGRDMQETAAELAPLAAYLVLTTLPPLKGTRLGRKPKDVATAFRHAKASSVEVIPDRTAALTALFDRPEPVLLVTGSFYLLEELRPIILQRAN